ncbi:MAG: class C sortase [Lachnospiraceae bacterium]|nr:class C sortase [Lachnospiraceae bacterium]
MKKFLKKRAVGIALVIVMVAGLCLILYPTVSDWWNTFRQTRAITSYIESVEEMAEAECETMMEAARSYNEKLAARNAGFVLSRQEEEEYLSLLDISGTGIMGYVQIPSIGVNLPIYHGTDADVLQTAIGHLTGSSLPVGGESAHCLISGHRGLPSAKLFTDLDRLEEGDIFTLTVLNQTATYQVDQIRVVLPEEHQGLGIESGEDFCTLITCTPYGVNSHRLLVRGRRIANLTGEQEVRAEAVKYPAYRAVLIIGIPLVLFILLVLAVYRLIRRPKKSTGELLADLRKDDHS